MKKFLLSFLGGFVAIAILGCIGVQVITWFNDHITPIIGPGYSAVILGAIAIGLICGVASLIE